MAHEVLAANPLAELPQNLADKIQRPRRTCHPHTDKPQDEVGDLIDVCNLHGCQQRPENGERCDSGRDTKVAERAKIAHVYSYTMH